MISTAFEFLFESATTARANIPVSVLKGRTSSRKLAIQVVVAYVHVVDSLAGEARSDRHVLFLHIQDQWHEPLDIRRRNVIPVGSLNQGLSQEVARKY